MGSEVARNQEGSASILLDTIRFNTTGNPITIRNSSIDVIHDETITLPDGSTYSPPVGYLALGSTNPTRDYLRGHGQIAPNYLFAQGITPSASLGLQYGSARLGPEGSLVWGGYDQNRVIRKVGVFEFEEPDQFIQANIVDIQVGVEEGASPFPSVPATGLLQLNNSAGPWQTATIDPVLPYLSLSPETCANIAKLLPVTLLPQKGIYMWNTADEQYSRIVNSPAYLAFVFQPSKADLNDGTNSNLTIKIPFRLLDLTLESPIVSEPQQYFPCSPYNISNDKLGVFLGRSFLQGAFLGANLNQSTLFLAQAPGPDAGDPNIQPIALEDRTIKSIPDENFAKSWTKHWNPLADNTTSSNSTGPTLTPTPTPAKTHSLSGGAIAGIVMGATLGLFLVTAVIATFILHRRGYLKRNWVSRPSDEDSETSNSRTAPLYGMRIHEKDSDAVIVEISTGKELSHEMPAGQLYEIGTEKPLPELPVDRF